MELLMFQDWVWEWGQKEDLGSKVMLYLVNSFSQKFHLLKGALRTMKWAYEFIEF